MRKQEKRDWNEAGKSESKAKRQVEIAGILKTRHPETHPANTSDCAAKARLAALRGRARSTKSPSTALRRATAI